ncbi:MAG: acetate kinase, partial [Burkholderiales bacterium]
MGDALLVLNAGSSSVKFSLYGLKDGAPRRELKGQIEGLPDAAHFEAPGAERRWGDPLAHEQATDFLLEWIEQRMHGRRLAAVGHRVVHGG